MKLVRFGEQGKERPGVWLEATDSAPAAILDVRAMAFDIADFNAHFFSHWGLERVAGLLREPRLKTVSAEGTRLGPPVSAPGKIVCVGANYAEHAREFGTEIPQVPVFFGKAGTSVIGPVDPVVLPQEARVVDGEVELAVVIGRRGRRLTEESALEHIAGYTILNDVTDREAQRAGRQWFRGKSPDSFCPIGPFLVTPDEIPDPRRLKLRSFRNAEVIQDGSTADMLFPVSSLLVWLSKAITLEPGDIVSTGTPAGIGSARNPPILLRPGDVLGAEITGLGKQRNPVVAEA